MGAERFFKANRPAGRVQTARAAIVLIAKQGFAALALLLAAAFAGGVRADTPALDLQMQRSEDGLYLSAQLDFELPPLVLDALQKGIPLHFVAEAELRRDRWYWTDARVAAVTRHMRLTYLPLTRRWRLNVSPTPIGNSGLGVSLGQNFDEVGEALAAVQRIARWRLADAAQLEPDARYNVDFRFRLDTSQLPRALQIGALGQSDWNLGVERNLRLAPDLR